MSLIYHLRVHPVYLLFLLNSLAMAEMALVPSIYRSYSTRIKPGFEHFAPGITSRFEVFTDDTFAQMKVSRLTIGGRTVG